MTTSTWKDYQANQQRQWLLHPWASAASLFGQLFAVFAVVDCLTGLHQTQSFREHVVGLAGRAIFFTAIAALRLRWRQSRHLPATTDSPST